MTPKKIIDLKQETIGLFDKEDMLAFFDFDLPADQIETVQGLCKISKPKVGKSKLNYLSLLFIIDTVDDGITYKIDAIMKRISWGDLKAHLKEIDMIVPIPHVDYDAQHYLKEIEVYLRPQQRITKPFLADELYPAILKAIGCRSHELTFWNEFSSADEDIEKDNVKSETNRSLIERMLAYFGRK